MIKICKRGLHEYEGRQCKVCQKAATQRLARQIAEYSKAWHLANKERRNADARENYKKNKAAFRARDRKWQKANNAYFAAKENKRKSAKLKRTPSWLTETHFAQIQMFYDSAAALTKELGIRMEVDHIVPLNDKNVSGLHVPWNLQILSKTDNSRKGNKF